MKPLLIIAEMLEPVVYAADGMHLDGLVHVGALRAMHPRARRRVRGHTAAFPEDLDLPLRRWHRTAHLPRWASADLAAPRSVMEGAEGRTGSVWGWAASAAHADWLDTVTRVDTRKRPALDEAIRYARDASWPISSGALKAVDRPHPAYFPHEIFWHAFGDRDGVEHCLRHVRAIGRLTGHGYGRVSRWRVEVWRGDDRTDVRRYPSEDPTAPAYGIRPPYHHASRRAPSAELDWLALTPC